jgi:hypothetical protein
MMNPPVVPDKTYRPKRKGLFVVACGAALAGDTFSVLAAILASVSPLGPLGRFTDKLLSLALLPGAVIASPLAIVLSMSGVRDPLEHHGMPMLAALFGDYLIVWCIWMVILASARDVRWQWLARGSVRTVVAVLLAGGFAAVACYFLHLSGLGSAEIWPSAPLAQRAGPALDWAMVTCLAAGIVGWACAPEPQVPRT